jgi:hypothetical protein
MRAPLLLIITLYIATSSFSQCLTGFNKLYPEPSIDTKQDFARSVSMFEDYMAVGIPGNDSLGRITGLVQIYQKSLHNNWNKIATIAPSDPQAALQFGYNVKLSKGYLLVSAAANGGKVYIYKKPLSGWSSSHTELAILKISNGVTFGIGYNNPVEISDDEQTIAITDPYHTISNINSYQSGAVFVFHKHVTDQWSESISPSTILPPDEGIGDFGRGGVSIQGNKIATSAPYNSTGTGAIYIFNDASGEFNNLTLEAELAGGSINESYFLGFYNLVFTADGIFASAVVSAQRTPKFGIVFFETPSSGTWHDGQRTCYIDVDGDTTTHQNFPLYISSASQSIFVSSKDEDGTGRFYILKKGINGWCDPLYESIDYTAAPPAHVLNYYGSVHSSSKNSSAAVGLVSHPQSNDHQIALKVLSKNNSNVWEDQLIYPSNKTTAGHYYGSCMVGLENYLFTGAPNDGTVKVNGGAVYIYKKFGGTWSKIGKLLPEIHDRYDDDFGTALATNGRQLAVGAVGFEPHGRVFVYANDNSDWSSIRLVQEIDLPSDLTVYSFGDHLAMSDDWLIIPYVQNAPAHIILAIYKANGEIWDFYETVEVGMANIFAKESTFDVAIEDDIIVAGTNVLHLENDHWGLQCTLSNSDHEPMQISSDFTHWITNGDNFGQAVAISDTTIFIGAPTKDFEGNWDVGAVYVYTKAQGTEWQTTTESAKILPRVTMEGELFGYSLKALYNTLIVGAPGADYKTTGEARNLPGRAYVFQAENYDWTNIISLIDFTGDSNLKDYFGVSVNMNFPNFFIGASIEDIPTGKLSGSVYVTQTPSILKLVPPICSYQGIINLFEYPFGGTWTGPGITNASEGILDPKIAGLGVHEYIYTTSSCRYQGKLQVEIKASPSAVLTCNKDFKVCPNTVFNIQLGLQEQQGATYNWYYHPYGQNNYSNLNLSTPIIQATQRGQYQAKIYNQSCYALSQAISVTDETIDVTVDSIGKTCQSNTEGVALTGHPQGGTWVGTGVKNNTFFPKSLADGTYTLNYNYKSPLGCNYQKNNTAEVVSLATPIIERSGSLCAEGNVTLSTQNALAADIYLYWKKKNDKDNAYKTIAENLPAISVNERGTYQLYIKNEVCENASYPFNINDSLKILVTPQITDFEICNDEVLSFSTTNLSGAIYEWYLANSPNEQGNLLAENSNTLVASESGFYHVNVSSGICTIESLPKHLVVHPADSIFIPNVITPNGDYTNDEFEIVTTSERVTYTIMNRFGEEVFNGTANDKWSANDVSSGVYFYYLTYNTCQGESKTLKGTIHVIK